MLTKFNKHFTQVIGHSLSPAQYGFNTMLELMNELVDTVNLDRSDTGDWLITPVNPSNTNSKPVRWRHLTSWNYIRVI